MDINPNSSKNLRGPIEAHQNFWDFLKYFRIDIWALVGPKEVENTNRIYYLMGNSQKNPKNLINPIEA